MSQPSIGYTFGFAAGVCFICATAVAGAAVSLKQQQEANKVDKMSYNKLAIKKRYSNSDGRNAGPGGSACWIG